MSSSVFEFSDYKSLLRHRIAQVRGNLTSFSQAAGCQPSYLSRVCSSKIQLTQDHAYRLARYWGLNEAEREYFMDLVDTDRAVDPGLKAALEKRAKKSRDQHADLQKRTNRNSSEEVQSSAAYHSHWAYAAVHFLTSAKEFTTSKAIAGRLWLPENLITTILAELVAWGFVRQKDKNFFFQSGATHIPKHSAALTMFHSNWRSKAVQDSQIRASDGVHFTNIQTVSRADFDRLKLMAAQFVEATTAIASPSQPEDLIVITCDVFKP